MIEFTLSTEPNLVIMSACPELVEGSAAPRRIHKADEAAMWKFTIEFSTSTTEDSLTYGFLAEPVP